MGRGIGWRLSLVIRGISGGGRGVDMERGSSSRGHLVAHTVDSAGDTSLILYFQIKSIYLSIPYHGLSISWNFTLLMKESLGNTDISSSTSNNTPVKPILANCPPILRACGSSANLIISFLTSTTSGSPSNTLTISYSSSCVCVILVMMPTLWAARLGWYLR